MNHRFRYAVGAPLLALLAALACPAARAQTANPLMRSPAAPPSALLTLATPVLAHAGFLKSVKGDVSFASLTGEWRPARSGDPITPTDRLVTGKDSGASAVLRDGTTLVVGPLSRLEIKDFSFDATTQEGNVFVSLVRGSLRMITGIIGTLRPESVHIETQTATISIRGTDFTLQVAAP